MKSRPNFDHPLVFSPVFIIFVSCCKYKFDFGIESSILAGEIDILVDGWSKATSWPTGEGKFCGVSGSTEVLSRQSGVDLEVVCG